MMAYAIFMGDGNDFRLFNLPSVPTRTPIVIRDTKLLRVGSSGYEKQNNIIWDKGSTVIHFTPDEPKLELGYNLIVVYDTAPEEEEVIGYT